VPFCKRQLSRWRCRRRRLTAMPLLLARLRGFVHKPPTTTRADHSTTPAPSRTQADTRPPQSRTGGGQREAFRGRARPSKARAARPRPAERGLQPSSKPPRPRPAASNPLEALPQNIESVPSIKANRHVHRVQKMMTSMRDRAIANFPFMGSSTQSHYSEKASLYDKISLKDRTFPH
jgi:hypothetical protein